MTWETEVEIVGLELLWVVEERDAVKGGWEGRIVTGGGRKRRGDGGRKGGNGP